MGWMVNKASDVEDDGNNEMMREKHETDIRDKNYNPNPKGINGYENLCESQSKGMNHKRARLIMMRRWLWIR